MRRAPDEHALTLRLITTIARRPRWRIAAILDVSGCALRACAPPVAPLTLVAPGVAVGMLILTVLTAIVLDGHIGPLALAGVATLVCGVVLVARGPGRIVDARVIAASGGFACALNAVLAKHARR